MRHASQPSAIEQYAEGQQMDTEQLPQLYQLARKGTPKLGRAREPGSSGEGPSPQQSIAATSVEDRIELSVRKARSRFFELPAEEVGASDVQLSGTTTQPNVSAHPSALEQPTLPAPVRAPRPHTVAALAGTITDFRPLKAEVKGPAAPPSNSVHPEVEPQTQKPMTSKSRRSQVPDARLLNPADPVNLRGLLDAIDVPLTPVEEDSAQRRLRAELTGLGPLDPLLDIPQLSDIFLNGTEVWYEAAGLLQRSDISLTDEEEGRALATRLLSAAGGRLDDSHPIADVQTENGLRVHAVLPPLSRGGTLLSIRLRATGTPTLADLQERGMLSEETGRVLAYLVRQRANFLISGGTGSGKTTLLSALLATCGADERLLLVEDTSELAPDHPHTVSLQAREANTEGRGEVRLSELIQAALRMRPTRLIVGECRGAEIADMLSAMNTGHSGTGGTVHANSTEAVPARLYAMGALAGLSERAVTLQAATALDYIIHIDRSSGQRQVREIAGLSQQSGTLVVRPVCRVEAGRRGPSLAWLPAGEQLRQAVQGAVGDSS